VRLAARGLGRENLGFVPRNYSGGNRKYFPPK
jgi:hypothetical protein